MCYEYIMERIDEELNDAEGYIHHAHKYKNEYRALSDLLYQLSVQEYNHAEMLMGHMNKVISASSDEAWQKIWGWYHKRASSREMEIKHDIDAYRG